MKAEHQSLHDHGNWVFYYCRLCARLRDILYEAPWSSFDLISTCVLFWIGVYLISNDSLFDKFNGVYNVLSRFGDESLWGWMFLFFGFSGMVNVLWIYIPSFGFRLLARMGVAFCFTSLALNNLGTNPPPISAITYSVLSVSALWAVYRTKPCGK